MDEDDEKTIELSAIAAIFPELVLEPPFTATLDLPVRPEKPLKIRFQSSTQAPPTGLITPPRTDSTEGGNATETKIPTPLVPALNIDVHSLTHLPPLKIKITLPDGYPQEQPPVVSVYSDPAWLPEQILKRIQNRCKELWEECGRDQVVYTFIDDVQQDAEKAFGLAEEPDSNFALSSDLKLVLLDYDLKCKQEEFENETFECGICLEPKKGRSCHRLMLCGHVFCVPCLQDFYNNCITEGDVDNVKCLDPGCGKESASNPTLNQRRKLDRSLNPSELLQIPIEQAQVQRYVRLKRKKRLEADKNTVYCPRQWCQGAAKSKKHPKYDDPLHEDDDLEDSEQSPADDKSTKKKKGNPEEIPMAERLCVCEDCGYAFCSVCKKGWHGELANCNPRRQAELNAEEQASLDYLKRFSTPCPTCSAPAQKTYGCNHMICFKCKTHFCYLCSSYLMPENPYKHFNELKSTCYMRLWELEGGDGADAGQGFGGGNAAPPPWEAEDNESDDSDSEEELEEEGFERFGGDDNIGWDEDTDDDEPAPDQRRADRPHIEIVNFARNGANRRIDLPANAPPPPQAPAPPANRRQGRRPRRGGDRQAAPRVNGQAPPAARQRVVPVPVPIAAVQADANANGDENPREEVQVPAAPGQGNNADAALQRFLRLALEDREDEWDSDEEDERPLNPMPRPRGGDRREQRRR